MFCVMVCIIKVDLDLFSCAVLVQYTEFFVCLIVINRLAEVFMLLTFCCGSQLHTGQFSSCVFPSREKGCACPQLAAFS